MDNFVKIKFYYYDSIDEVDKIESMWATQIGNTFKIENSPFYIIGFALGDIISVKEIDGELFVANLIEASGNSNIQIIFYDKNIVQQTREELKELGCSSELSNIPSLIAVNVPSDVNYFSKVKPYLERGSEYDLWDYQEACLAHQE